MRPDSDTYLNPHPATDTIEKMIRQKYGLREINLRFASRERSDGGIGTHAYAAAARPRGIGLERYWGSETCSLISNQGILRRGLCCDGYRYGSLLRGVRLLV